ncbi:MAG: dTDP-glucose 4,6-dehydratase [Candidatus Omnitrophica bacterium]|nr:dTDP-glucose 4,6-dehydratase [Candidatus Omnitrophota bacterium]
MCKGLPKVLITGGAGFIGSAFTRLAVKRGYRAIVLDKLTYAGDLTRLKEIEGRYKFYRADISCPKQIAGIFKKESPKIIVNFAAESHVDRSILDAGPFIKTNILGTQVLLDAARRYKVGRFIHISTDEIYGETIKGKFSEDSPLKPNSPYAASKAAGDLLIKSYIRTYGFPAIIVRPSNNYGPWQYPEKLLPLAILKILRNEKIPIYGKGRNTREWLYVTDCARGILSIMERARLGGIYNLGSGAERKNIDIISAILKIFRKGRRYIKFVKDRPGHDLRYRLDSEKVFKETGWQPEISLKNGLEDTVEWCLEYKDWLLSKHRTVALLYKYK